MSKCPFKRNEVIGLVKRFVKPEAYMPARDVPMFYKIYALFPNEKFWRSYDLGFQLNAILWFLSEDGKNKLKTDLAIFTLDIPEQTKYDMSETKTGEDIVVNKKKTTVADLFKS